MTAPTYSTPRYKAAGVLVRVQADGMFKTRAHRLLDALRARWSHRQGGYILPETKAAKFARLYAAGYDAGYLCRDITPPKGQQ